MIFAVPLFACLSEFIKYRVKKRQEYNQEQEELVTKKR
jgi:hypothetical protein